MSTDPTAPEGTSPSAALGRRTWRTLEPYHGMIYFVPEGPRRYEELGVKGRSQYFGSRSAPMGAVGPLVVHATFFNFHPGLVDHAMAGLWDRVGPDELLVARHAAVDDALRRILGDEIESEAMREAATLLRPVAEAAMSRPEGRALFAGHARLPEPEDQMPHLQLWWAVTLLREFRGDGHIAALVDAELSGLDALILHAASGEVTADVLRRTRGWSQDEWQAGIGSLAARGLVDEQGAFTPAGAELRQHVEDRTDELAAVAWRVMSEADADRLRELVRPWSKSMSAAMFT